MSSNKVFIFDTTLRDGEQSPGATMTIEEKIRLASQLEMLGVDIMEAGFPAASEGDFEAVRLIANKIKNVQIAGLCRAMKSDIDRGWEALKHAANGRIHIFLATSEIHMKYKLQKTRAQVLEMIADAVKYASAYTTNIEFSAEDASRSDKQFLAQAVEIAIKNGAKVINIPDTVGYIQPQEYGELINYLFNTVPNINESILSVHGHNDLGVGVANTLSGLKNGARQAEVTLSGIGERAGNSALEEIVMALKTRKDYYNLTTNIKTEQLYPSCRLLSLIIGQPIPANKPIIGANAFAHESGIHQDGVLKNPETYEIIKPQTVGRDNEEMVIGKHSGRHAVADQLKKLGYELNAVQISLVFDAVKRLADKKKQIFIEDLEAIVLDEIFAIPDKYKITYTSCISGNMAIPTAVLKMDINGFEHQIASFGAGPVDALFNAISTVVGKQPVLKKYAVNALTGGTDAQGEVTVHLQDGKNSAVGRGSDPDIIMASGKAYINALNRLAKKEEEQK